jgi:hypothetical protein
VVARRKFAVGAALVALLFSSVCNAAEEFTVGCVNCGAFRYGKNRASESDFKASWLKLAKDWPQDVFFFEDVGKGRLGNISCPKFDIRASAKNDPAAVDVVVLANCIDVGQSVRRTSRHRALRLTYDIGGKTLAVYGVHLVAEGHIRAPKPAEGEMSFSQKLRQIQFKELIEDAKRFDFAVLAGDFNAQKPWEYDIFGKSGFTVANCSEKYGVKATLRNIPADNIIISTNLTFKDFRVLEDYVLNTDHFPLVAKVQFPDGVTKNCAAKIPAVAEFLEKPALERRRLFKDVRFRRKAFKANYPDGKGLLSRWVRVENIPNLRDVGGIVNKNGIAALLPGSKK